MHRETCDFEKGAMGGADSASTPIDEDEYIDQMSSPWRRVYEREDKHRWKDPANEFIDVFFEEDERKHFLKVSIRDLIYLCELHYAEPWLPDMLVDAIMFFRLHKKWVVHICPTPECHCLFADEDSLILHLIREHRYAWPCLQRKPPHEDLPFAEALRSTVWKPIDVEAVKGVAARLSADPLGALEWPLSQDPGRIKHLAELQEGFQALLNSRQVDCLRAIIALASDIILTHLDPSNKMPLPFRTLLCCSPLCIRFMDDQSLSCFVELVKDLQVFLSSEASQSTDLEGHSDSGFFDAVSISDGSDFFVLDGDKIREGNHEGIGAWLVDAPIFPTIKGVPAESSSILQQAKSLGTSLSEHLRTVSVQSSLKSAGLTSCFKLWNMGHWLMPLFGTMPFELALDSGPRPAIVDRTPSSPCHSAPEPAKRQKIARDSQMMQQRLTLIKLTYKLQFLESHVRSICTVDLRKYILPLLRSSLRMKLYMFMRREIQCLEDDAESGCPSRPNPGLA